MECQFIGCQIINYQAFTVAMYKQIWMYTMFQIQKSKIMYSYSWIVFVLSSGEGNIQAYKWSDVIAKVKIVLVIRW